MTARRRLQARAAGAALPEAVASGIACCDGHAVGQFASFDAAPEAPNAIDARRPPPRGFAQARTAQGVNLFDAVAEHVKAANAAGRRVRGRGLHRGLGEPPAASAAGARRHDAGAGRRLSPTVQRPAAPARSASPSGRSSTASCSTAWRSSASRTSSATACAAGQRKRRPSERFIAEAAALERGRPRRPSRARHRPLRRAGDARGPGAPHDCLRLIYDGGDKLFVPVENIDVLSRYGSADEGAALDRLGGVAWQSRKARVKQRIRDMADELISIAAERAVRRGETMSPPEGALRGVLRPLPLSPRPRTSCARSPTCWTTWPSGKPMDRLICGDVGFGKTEVALRAAFVAAMSGKQVAVIGADHAAGAPALPHLQRALRRACRCGSASCRAWSPPRRRKETKDGAHGGQDRHRRSAPTRCWPRASSSRISAW